MSYVGFASGWLFIGIHESLPTGSVVTKLPSLPAVVMRNQPSVEPSASTCTPGRPVYSTVTVKVVPVGSGVDGVMTSFVAGHCVPTCDAEVDCGEQAGGFGFDALTGFTVEAACASGSGSSGPLGSPG